MGVGPMCSTSLSTGFSEWELGPCHTEWSPINPGDFEIMFIKAGDSETKEELKIEEARSQRRE